MIYGQLQYYRDELSGWSRVAEFNKVELRKIISQIGALRRQQVFSITSEKLADSFLDQLLVQEQQLEHIANQIVGQQQRLDLTSNRHRLVVENSISQQQDSLRSKSRNAERNFIRIKYTCSSFLSTFLSTTPQLSPVQ